MRHFKINCQLEDLRILTNVKMGAFPSVTVGRGRVFANFHNWKEFMNGSPELLVWAKCI